MVKRYEYDRQLWIAQHAPAEKTSEDRPAEPEKAQRRSRRRYDGVLVADLVEAFMVDANSRYVKHGRPTGTARNYWNAIKPILLRYGEVETRRFTLDTLEEYQRDLDRSRRLCRRQVNKRIQAIVYVFTWGARHRIGGERIVPADIAAELRLIAPLRSGYAESVDHPRKRAASQADVDAVLPFLTRPSPIWSGCRC